MNTDDAQRLLHSARPLPADRVPRREALRLRDGYPTSVYVYDPPPAARRCPVLYLHGIQSHPGWFAGSGAALAEAGFPVFQVVRRGSADNRRDRGHARSASQLLADVRTAHKFALERTGAARAHLLGVSWGGKLAAAAAVQHRDARDLASLTLIAPGICAKVGLSVWRQLAVGLSLLPFPKARFDIPLGEAERFTDNEPMRAYLRSDPLALHRATARFLFASRQLDRLLREADRGSIGAATALVLASRDRIIDNAATQEELDRLTGGQCTVHELPAAHVLEFEPDPRPFYDLLIAALRQAEES